MERQNFNYHTHTKRCGHADFRMSDEDYVKEFIKQGFSRICFTDHVPLKGDIDPRKRIRMSYDQVDEYLSSIDKLKQKYERFINIESGFEFEYINGHQEDLLDLKSKTDKMILGQHFIVDDNGKILIFRYHDFTNSELLTYAKTLKEAMKSQIPDIIAHPDLYMVNRKSFGEIESFVADIIFKAAEKYQIPIEINLTEPFMFLNGQLDHISYPSKQFFKQATKYDIKVVYGIDAHFKDQIEEYDTIVEFTNKYLSYDVISKLHFCDENLNRKNKAK